MATERLWAAVSPQPLAANGTALGLIIVADTAGFRTKQVAYLKSNSLPNLPVQVKKVLSPTMLVVGAVDQKISSWKPLDISGYTVADGASIGAEEQPRTALPPTDDHYQASWESDPVVADRVIFVDKYGRFYDNSNPLPIAFDGTVSIGRVRITSKDNDASPDTTHSSVRIGGTDGTSEVNVHPDGSLDTRVVNKLITVPHDTIQVTASTPAGDPTTILFKTGGLGGTTVATLNIAYDGSGNFQSVVRTP